MKRIAIILSIVAASAMIFSACGKYEEGPAFSLATKKARIVGIWTVTEMTVNGTVQDISYFSGMKTEMKKDGTSVTTVAVFGITISVDGEWRFDDSKEKFEVRMKDGENWEDWTSSEIIKLTGSELWLRDIETEAGIEYTTITKLTKE